MKISVLQENISKSLSQILRIIPSKPQQIEHGAVFIKTENDRLSLSTKNHSAHIVAHVPATIETPGEVVVSAKEFASILSSLKAGEVSILVVGGSLKIKSQKSKASLQIMELPTEGFQAISLASKGIKLGREDLYKLLQWGSLAMGSDEARPAFSSLMIEVDDEKLTAVSTDGFRLARATLLLGIGKDVEKSKKTEKAANLEAEPTESKAVSTANSAGKTMVNKVIIPQKTARELVRWISEAVDDSIYMTLSDDGATFSSNNGVVVCRLVDVEYPNYKAIIPQSSELVVSVGGEELSYAMKAVSSIDRVISRQQIVQFHISEKKMVLSSQGNEIGGVEVEVDADIVWERAAKELDIAFNAQFILPILSMGLSTISIGINDSLKPVAIRDQAASSSEFEWLYVAMPFRANS